MPSTYDLKGQVAIVTGVSSGIGHSTAQLLLHSQCSVLGIDVAPLTDEALLAQAADPSSHFAFHCANITQTDAPAAIVAACVQRFGERIDILANVAGVMDNMGNATTVPDLLLDKVLDVNLKAPIRLMGAVLPTMVAGGGGCIVNVASRAGLSGVAAGIACRLGYAGGYEVEGRGRELTRADTASKHGLVGATKNTAWQFRDKGVRCNAVAPGGAFHLARAPGADG